MSSIDSLICWALSVAVFIVCIILFVFPDNRPNTLQIKTDYTTGCEYVSTGTGLTARMGSDGKQRGCKS